VLKHEIFFCHVDSPGEFLALCFIIDLFYWNIILETPKMEGNGINKDLLIRAIHLGDHAEASKSYQAIDILGSR
jgi:hypothetical protein